MKNTDTGEFELVLGNKQLLSGFFIVVILFGVFFIMGYILGRNSTPAGTRTASAETAAPPVTQAESRPPAVSGTSAPATAESPKGGEQTPAETGTQAETQPAREPDAPKAAAVSAVSSNPGAMAVTEPEPGQTYLQVMAVKRPEAEVVARTLKDKGFPASLGPGPNELLRVLVGPYKDAASLGAAKAELENAGFHPIVRK